MFLENAGAVAEFTFVRADPFQSAVTVDKYAVDNLAHRIAVRPRIHIDGTAGTAGDAAGKFQAAEPLLLRKARQLRKRHTRINAENRFVDLTDRGVSAVKADHDRAEPLVGHQ